jgi:hypothetical protein
MRTTRNRTSKSAMSQVLAAAARAVAIEALEPRRLAGGMIALTATDLVLGGPDDPPERSATRWKRHRLPARGG